MSADPSQTSEPAPVPPPIPSQALPFDQAFLAILANAAKREGPGPPAREQGFVIVARDAPTLQPLQALCHQPQQGYNQCFTARYHLRSRPVLGTLLSAFAADVERLRSSRIGSEALPGDFLPQIDSGVGLAGSDWSRLLRSPGFTRVFQRWDTQNLVSGGGLRSEWLSAFLAAIAEPETLGTGDRLVLFCEVKGDPGTGDDWQRLLEAMHPMPERLGLVLSGPPDGFTLPEDDVHFLEVSLAGAKAESGGDEIHYRYSDSALAGDQAAERDHLGVAPYADGLARLILLPETQPLTIGIHAPWGGGKSSLMNFIRQALVRNVVEKDLPEARPRRSFVQSVWRINSARRGTRFLLALMFQFWTLAVRLSPSRVRTARLFYALEEVEEASARRAAGPDEPDPRTERSSQPSDKQLEVSRRALMKGLEKGAERNVLAVQFDAWRYENANQIWAGLAQQITFRLEQALSLPARSWSRFLYAVQKRPAEFFIGLFIPVVLAMVAGALSFYLGVTVLGSGTEWWIKILAPAGSVAATALFVAWRVQKVMLSVSDRVLDYVRAPDYRSEMGYQHQVIDDLRFLRRRMERRRALFPRRRPDRETDGPRVVVFIDNLDRCSDEKVVEVLSAINLILGASDFFVFLGVDTEMVHQSIARLRGYGPDDPAGGTYAENYLRKIIQLSFQLPETRTEKRVFFISQLFSGEARQEFGVNGNGASAPGEQTRAEAESVVRRAPAVNWFPADVSVVSSPRVQNLTEVKDTKEELDAFRNMQEFIPGNPRELKRLVNVHRLVKILLWRPEAPPKGMEQKKLVHWLVFCARWPDLVDTVLRQAVDVPPHTDCIAVICDHKDELLRSLVERLKGAPLCAADLQPDSTLDRAARISRMVAEQPSKELAATQARPVRAM